MIQMALSPVHTFTVSTVIGGQLLLVTKAGNFLTKRKKRLSIRSSIRSSVNCYCCYDQWVICRKHIENAEINSAKMRNYQPIMEQKESCREARMQGRGHRNTNYRLRAPGSTLVINNSQPQTAPYPTLSLVLLLQLSKHINSFHRFQLFEKKRTHGMHDSRYHCCASYRNCIHKHSYLKTSSSYHFLREAERWPEGYRSRHSTSSHRLARCWEILEIANLFVS